MTRRSKPSPDMPSHWTPEQALAVFECIETMKATLWACYGSRIQQAWRDQLVTGRPPPQLDPHEPF